VLMADPRDDTRADNVRLTGMDMLRRHLLELDAAAGTRTRSHVSIGPNLCDLPMPFNLMICDLPMPRWLCEPHESTVPRPSNLTLKPVLSVPWPRNLELVRPPSLVLAELYASSTGCEIPAGVSRLHTILEIAGDEDIVRLHTDLAGHVWSTW
jgi:hypothetical protein